MQMTPKEKKLRNDRIRQKEAERQERAETEKAIDSNRGFTEQDSDDEQIENDEKQRKAFVISTAIGSPNPHFLD